MAIVNYAYYSGVYMGQEADESSFPALEARAEDVIGAMTRWKVTEATIASLPVMIQTLYKKAVCAQIDSFSVNGLDSVAVGNDGRGWTVGKVSVNNGRYRSQTEHSGAMSAHISPLAIMYLEQSGLMNPQVETIPQMPVLGGWL